MKYPNITIKIRNFIPTLEFQPAEGESKPMFTLDLGLDTLLMNSADLIGYNDYQNATDILQFIRGGDENFIEFGKIELGQEQISTKHVLDGLKTAIAERPATHNDSSDEVNAELTTYWQADVLASVLEEAYAILIAQAVFNASELGLNIIVLDDDQHEIRLQEKAGKEIGAVEQIELIVT